MRTWMLFRRELGRLLRSPAPRLTLLLAVLSPAAGLALYRPVFSISDTEYVTTMLGTYLGNPALAGGVAGGILFAILTVAELDRVHRSGASVLTEAVVSPLTAGMLQLGALLCTAVLAQAAAMLLWLPYTMHATGAVFDGGAYAAMYLLGMLGGMVLSVLLAAAAYQFTRRVDVSLMLYAAMAGLSLTVWSQKWLLCWLNPCVWAISDDFTNNRLFLSVAWQRLVWLLGLSGMWLLSLLCVRRYGKNALGSFRCNGRRLHRPAIALALLACSVTAYARQPMVDHSNRLLDDAYHTQDYSETVTCSGWQADITPDPDTGCLSGVAAYQMQNTGGQEETVRFSVDPGYAFTKVTANGREISCVRNPEEQMNEALYAITLPPDPEIELVIHYGGYPQEWNLVDTMQGDPEISRSYMRLENQTLNPAPFDVTYQGDTMPGTVRITLPQEMRLIPFGAVKAELLRENGEDGTNTWQVEDTGFYMILYAGDYVSEQIRAQGLTVDFYYGRKHQPIMEQADAAGAVKTVIDYCTTHYGPLRFYADGRFSLIQTRVSGGGYAGGGASTLDEIDFTAQNLRSPEKGGSSGDVMIHELVHQWWGLGNMFNVEDAAGPWSSEGLTVYTTYRILKERNGAAWAQRNCVEQWQQALDDYNLNFYVRHPEYLDALPEDYRADIANSLSGVRRYSEMPLKILKAEQLVGGEEAMDAILYGLFNRELDWSYPYLTYQEFLDACGLTEEDLSLG